MLFIQKYVNHTTLWLVQIPWSYIPAVASTPGSASTLMSFTKPSSTTSPFFFLSRRSLWWLPAKPKIQQPQALDIQQNSFQSSIRTNSPVDQVHCTSVSFILFLRSFGTLLGAHIEPMRHVFQSNKFRIIMSCLFQPFHKLDRRVIQRICISANQIDMVRKALRWGENT